MGRWSASHWKTATFGGAGSSWRSPSAASLGTKTLYRQRKKRQRRVRQRPLRSLIDPVPPTPPKESVLIQSTTLTTGDTAFKAAVADAGQAISPPTPTSSRSTPRTRPRHEGQISARRPHRARHSSSCRARTRQVRRSTSTRSLAATAAVAKRASRPLRSARSATRQLRQGARRRCSPSSCAKAGERSIPVTLAVLLITFGALVAAGPAADAGAERGVRNDGAAGAAQRHRASRPAKPA